MELTSRQLSSLNEMGIPVWRLRSNAQEPEVVTASEQASEQLLRCTWIILVNKEHSEQAQRLLYAMLSAIAVSPEQVALISSEQLPQLQSVDAKQKVLLVLSDEITDLSEQAISRGEIHQTQTIQINTVCSFGLNELLAEPEKKAEAWQDLQLAQSTLSQ